MTKREFLASLGGAALAAVRAFGAVPPGPAARKHWAWMRPDLKKTAGEWTRAFSRMQRAGIRGLNVEVYNGREAFYRSRKFPVRAEFLETIIPIARQASIEMQP